jgi:alpha/beta superfamily hydrolase
LTELSIEGPAGILQERLSDAHSDVAAILCHPHPLYGGSMDDRVLGALELAFEQANVASLKFNFRGVGASAGSHDEGLGELEDLMAVSEWLRANTSYSKLILSGYSFGGSIVLGACGMIDCEKLILVAPAIGFAGPAEPPKIGGLAILAERDQFVSVEKAQEWFDGTNMLVDVLPGVDHSFFGGHDRITEKVAQFLIREDV